MHWMGWVLALAALVIAHGLRAPGRGLARSAAAFVLALVICAGLIRIGAGELGLGRTTDFDRVVNHAVAIARQDDAPLLVFSGASFSRNGIDDERLTLALREAGYPHRVVSLSLEAAPFAERAAHLDQFMAESGRVPDLVFMEVSMAFDERPGIFFDNSKFSVRAIEQFDPPRARSSARGLAEGQCDGLPACARDSLLIAAHALVNALNTGLLSRGEAAREAGSLAAYDPADTPREAIDPLVRARKLRESPVIAPTSPDWVRRERTAQRARLLQRGVREVGYYLPPVIDPPMRAYLAGLCDTEFAGRPCVAPVDPALLAALDRDVWLDETHLLDAGTAVYSRWLAARLVDSGWLDGPTGAPAIAALGAAR